MNSSLSRINSIANFEVRFKPDLVDKIPLSAKRVALLVTPEYEGITRNGGIGTYYRTLSEKLAAADFSVVLLLCQSQEKFGGESIVPALKQVFSTQECRNVLELTPTHVATLSQLPEWEWVDYENYCALFFAQAIATTFPHAYVYIEFPEMLGLGYRTVQAKRSGLLGENCVVAVTLHSGQEWLQEAHGNYLQPVPKWFQQTCHYEQYSFENADLAFFLSHFLKEKVAKYGWKTDHGLHLPYCFTVITQPTETIVLNSSWQRWVDSVDKDKIPLIFFGRLEERKGLFTFLEALQILESRIIEKLHIIFIGKNVNLQTGGLQGVDSQKYIEQQLGKKYCYSIVTNLFSQEAIQLVGQLPSPIACLTSSQENFPHTALEMGQLPISLVVSNTGGFQETLNLIGRTAGLHWFISREAGSLAQAMIQAISVYPEKINAPMPHILHGVNQRLLNQRFQYMKQAFSEMAMPAGAPPDKNEPRRWILGMTSLEEQVFLEDYARNEYSGRGEIVELGCWFGSSTISLAMGLEDNSSITNKKQRIHAYDIFVWSPDSNMQQSVNGTALEGKYQDGDSFLDEYRQRISPWNDLVQVYPGDLTELGWHQPPIEFLFIDAMKSWELANSILKNFFPCLVPKVSLVLHQDFAHFYTSWIHLIMYRLRDYLVPIKHSFIYSSRVFRYTQEIPQDLLQADYSFDTFSREEVEAAFDYSMAITPQKMQPNIMAAKVMYFIHVGEFAQARLEFSKSIAQLSSNAWLELIDVQRVAKMYYSIDLLEGS